MVVSGDMPVSGLDGDRGSAGITCCAVLLSPEAGGSDKASEGILLLVLSGASAGAVGDKVAVCIWDRPPMMEEDTCYIKDRKCCCFRKASCL